jgi:hypothetical protein
MKQSGIAKSDADAASANEAGARNDIKFYFSIVNDLCAKHVLQIQEHIATNKIKNLAGFK